MMLNIMKNSVTNYNFKNINFQTIIISWRFFENTLPREANNFLKIKKIII